MLVLLLSPLLSDLPNDYHKTSPMMQTVGGGVLRSLGRDDPSLGRASVLAPANQRIVSCGGCGKHGNCDMRYGNCSCQMGWGGPHCERGALPVVPPLACASGRRATWQQPCAAMCASLRRLSPVACECIAECLRHGHEVCAPGSYGCQLPWKYEPARRCSWQAQGHAGRGDA